MRAKLRWNRRWSFLWGSGCRFCQVGRSRRLGACPCTSSCIGWWYRRKRTHQPKSQIYTWSPSFHWLRTWTRSSIRRRERTTREVKWDCCRGPELWWGSPTIWWTSGCGGWCTCVCGSFRRCRHRHLVVERRLESCCLWFRPSFLSLLLPWSLFALHHPHHLSHLPETLSYSWTTVETLDSTTSNTSPWSSFGHSTLARSFKSS